MVVEKKFWYRWTRDDLARLMEWKFFPFSKIRKFRRGHLAAIPDEQGKFKNAINQKVEEIFQIRRRQWTRGVLIDLKKC